MKLICPICQKPLISENKSVCCENHHCFDFAKSGYLNLLLKQSKDHGDNPIMVKARTAFLETNHYHFLREELSRIIKKYAPSSIADLGCGEGYYTKMFDAKEVYGFDLSKDALKHASKQDKNTQYVVSSIFNLPLENQSIDLAITCFAPFAKDEVERILSDQGIFIFVTPGPYHLYELKEKLYEHPYLNTTEDLDTSLNLIDTIQIKQAMNLRHDSLINLFNMTPYAYKTGVEGMNVLNTLDHLDVTADFIIRVYQKNNSQF